MHNKSYCDINVGNFVQVGVHCLLFCRRINAEKLSFNFILVILTSIGDLYCFHLFLIYLVALLQFFFRGFPVCLFLVHAPSLPIQPLSPELDA